MLRAVDTFGRCIAFRPRPLARVAGSTACSQVGSRVTIFLAFPGSAVASLPVFMMASAGSGDPTAHRLSGVRGNSSPTAGQRCLISEAGHQISVPASSSPPTGPLPAGGGVGGQALRGQCPTLWSPLSPKNLYRRCGCPAMGHARWWGFGSRPLSGRFHYHRPPKLPSVPAEPRQDTGSLRRIGGASCNRQTRGSLALPDLPRH